MATSYKLNTGYITQKVGDKTTVFSGEKSLLFTFNDSAALIFQGLKLGWSEEKIMQKLLDGFDVTESQVKKDIKDFIHEMEEKKILVKVSSK